MDRSELRYLELLSENYPTIADASAEIINLSAVLNLPKGTEIFASDIHGEADAFSHILKNGSGSVRLKIDDAFGDGLTTQEKNELATLAYYPHEKMTLIFSAFESEEEKEAWMRTTIERLVALCKQASGKYTRSKVRKAMPAEFAYAIDELMTENNHAVNRERYHRAIIDSAINIVRGPAFIEAL